MRCFTLIETLVALGIFGLIIVLVFSLISVLYRTQGYSWQQSLAIDEARRGVETIVKEAREAKQGDDGSFVIEQAGDKEFIFYSDIDQDDQVERVRYFLGEISSGQQTQYCFSLVDGGSCNVLFSDFLTGELQSARLEVSVEGDFGLDWEYADIYVDGNYLGAVCQSGCSDCAGDWQGTAVFDLSQEAADGFLNLMADATVQVDNMCFWQEPHHSMKVKFTLSWQEEIIGLANQLKKGVIDPTTGPVEYPVENEQISILSSYVRNSPPIFEYFDQSGQPISDYSARLSETKVMKVYLVINVDPNKPPQDFELESYVQLRNLKEEY